PLNRAAKGFVITQYDMRDCEKVGLIKLDLLSQRGLGVLEDGLQAIARHGKTIEVDIENPDELSADPEVARLFKSGRTVGCFDAESPMIRGLIRRLGTHSYDLHMVATSLIRPGVSASGMMDEFIKRHNDPASIKHIHPKMGEILKDTHGIIVYQEDVLKVLHELAGVTLGEADILRRMMSGKSTDSRFAKDELENKFMENCEARGIDKEAREKIWNQVASFVGYSFCKAHAAQFAILAYQTAWLKAHHTAEFFAARLANMGGFFPPDLYVRDARRFGLSIELPEVNRSERTYEGKDNRIIMGLEQVGCLQEASVDSILLARNTGGPFASVADFLARTGVGYEQTHALIRVGAFRSLHAPRPVLLGELDEAVRAKMRQPSSTAPAAPRQSLLFAGRIGAEKKNETFFDRDEIDWRNDYSLFEQLQAEVDVIGFIVSIHPLEPLAEAMRKAGFVQASDMNRFDGKRVRMGGILTAFKPVTTKNNDPMAIISLEDLSGTFDTVIFPEAYKRHALMLRSQADGGLCVEGKIQVSFGLANLIVEKVLTLGEALGIKARRRRPIGDVKMGPRVTVPTYPPDIEHKESIESTESKEHVEIRGENRVSEPCATPGPV
ncbi:MAG: hypothetical protein ABIC40_04760, partial [bacterium]